MIYAYVGLLFFVFGLPLIRFLLGFYPEYLWFQDVGFSSIFLKIWGFKLGLLFLSFIFVCLFLYINIVIALRVRAKFLNEPRVVGDNAFIDWDKLPITKGITFLHKMKWIKWVIIVMFGIILSSLWIINWEKVLLFLNAVAFDKTDPLFNRDLGFYFFSYPFFQLIQGWCTSILVVTLLLVCAIYFSSQIISIERRNIGIKKQAKVHLSILVAILFVLMAWAFQLGMVQLLYSSSGIVYGAGYTDIHADLMGYRIMFGIALVVAILTLVNIFRHGILLPLEGIAVLVLVSVLLKGFYPTIIQNFVVKPNEIKKEQPYIDYHIQYTRDAYQLSQIKEKTISINYQLSGDAVKNNKATFDNIRLWDHRPLLKTLSQLQEIRLYYDFNDVDIDRYWINGEYRQVMLAARELNADQIPIKARNWINQKLTYTHGYGVVVLPVNKKTTEGLPQFYMYDIPPKSSVDLPITQPAIYFGEATNQYIIVNTKTNEFDFPKGDSNEYATYSAKSGIVLTSLFRKILFALKFQEIKLLFSDYITKESKVLYDRNIVTRVKKIAPFLQFEADPYITLINGELKWIVDAYVVSQYYPYAKPVYGNVNYIRNSVKVVVDAYSGKCTFYVMDESEPITQAYAKIFPDLFKGSSEIPAEIKKHFRYPQQLFLIQSKMYETFHMTNHQVFYNQEDLWVIPNETYDENTQPMEPYYAMIQLPEDERLTFRLMMPFTPAKKNNMIAWMSANSDFPNYGQITVYKLPKEQLVYGPMQIESRIDQDTEISQLLTLWGQKGSRVIRGNLLVIPIENSFLYVEPIYLQATQSRFPELKQVVVAYNNKIVMEDTFEEALAKVLEFSEIVSDSSDPISSRIGDTSEKNYSKSEAAQLKRANGLFQEAEQAMKQGDWETYGKKIKALGRLLKGIR